MLIIQIALGIVLAAILIALLPQILSMTIWIGMAAVAIAIVVLAAHFISEFLSVIMGVLILSYLAALIYSATKWKSILRSKKIEELNIELSNLQQMLSIIEHTDHSTKDLKASLVSKQNIRKKIKDMQAQREKLVADDAAISVSGR